MGQVVSPLTWNQKFRDGTIYETEFFHGLVSCAKHVPVGELLRLLSEEECMRFERMVRQLVSLDDVLDGQTVTSVVRYDIADARPLLKELKALREA